MIIKPKGPVWGTDILDAQGRHDVFAKFVLVALGVYADDNGASYMPQSAIAEHTGMSTRCVREKLASLADLGHITRFETYHPGDGSRTADIIVLHPGQPDIPPDELFKVATATAKRTFMKVRRPDEDAPPRNPVPGGPPEPGAGPTGTRFRGEGSPGSGQENTYLEHHIGTPPLTPKGGVPSFIEDIWQMIPTGSDGGFDLRKRTSRKQIGQALAAAMKDGAEPERVVAAIRAYHEEPDNRRSGWQYAMGAHRIITTGLWESYAPPQKPPPRAGTDGDAASLFGPEPDADSEVVEHDSGGYPESLQRRWMQEFIDNPNCSWPSERGRPPGRVGCRVHPAIQAELLAAARKEPN